MTGIRARILDAAVASYRPDVLLVDKQPLGVDDELRSALSRLREDGGRAVLGLRDVLDDAAAVREEWTPSRTSVVLEHYGRVLVYGRENVFDTLRRSGLPSELEARTRYCGYVTTPPTGDAKAARTIRGFRSGARSRPIVLGTTGGGEDGRRVLDAFVDAAAGAPWEAIAVTGPQLDAAAARAFRRRAAAAGVAVRTFVPELAGWFGVVDAVVCMGGYNTLIEALVRGAPTVCVPRTAPRREQLIRARALEDLDLLGVVELDQVGVDVLRAAIESALMRSRSTIARAARSALDFGGAGVAAESLLAEAALSRPRSRPMMSRMLERYVGAPATLEELKHKPGRRLTLRASGPERSAIVKLYRSDRVLSVAARVAALSTGPPEPEIPEVLAVDPDSRMIVLSEVRGTPLREAVLALTRPSAGARAA